MRTQWNAEILTTYSKHPKSECSVWETERKMVWLSDIRISDIRAVRFVPSIGYTVNVQNLNEIEHSVGPVDQLNVRNQNEIIRISDVVRNQNDSTTKPKRKAPKSGTFGFRTFTVRMLFAFQKVGMSSDFGTVIAQLPEIRMLWI